MAAHGGGPSPNSCSWPGIWCSSFWRTFLCWGQGEVQRSSCRRFEKLKKPKSPDFPHCRCKVLPCFSIYQFYVTQKTMEVTALAASMSQNSINPGSMVMSPGFLSSWVPPKLLPCGSEAEMLHRHFPAVLSDVDTTHVPTLGHLRSSQSTLVSHQVMDTRFNFANFETKTSWQFSRIVMFFRWVLCLAYALCIVGWCRMLVLADSQSNLPVHWPRHPDYDRQIECEMKTLLKDKKNACLAKEPCLQNVSFLLQAVNVYKWNIWRKMLIARNVTEERYEHSTESCCREPSKTSENVTSIEPSQSKAPVF